VYVAIAAGLLPYPHRPPQIRQDGFEVGNDRWHALGFGFHTQQGLFEIEIKRKGSNQTE
jgi:hypothetical protein